MPDQFQISLTELGTMLISSLLIYAALIFLSRWVGPRSFSQLTAFDFAVTVALGAIVGSTATGGVTFIDGFIGLFLLFLIRWLVARSRRKGLARLVDNSPILLMDGPKILPEFLKRAKLTEGDLLQSLRKKGITNLDQIKAVVMERDGSISVLRAGEDFDPYLLQGVKGHPAEGKIEVRPPLEDQE